MRIDRGIAVLLAVAVVAAVAGWAAPVLAEEKAAGEAKMTEESQAAETAAPADGGFLCFDGEMMKNLDEFHKNVTKPCDYFSWGGDLRLRTIYGDNFLTLADGMPRSTWHFQRYRSRLWARVMPIEDVALNARLVWEPRVYQRGVPADKVIWDEVLFDKLNVEFSNIAGLPVDMKIGRQDIIFGTGWLVLDGTPLDGSRTIHFDAWRTTVRLDDMATKVDAIFLAADSDEVTWIQPWAKTGQRVVEENQRGAILYVTNKSLEDALIEGYYMWKHDSAQVGTGYDGDKHVIGGRTVLTLGENWVYAGEFAYQWGTHGAAPFGEVSQVEHRALGTNNRVTFKLGDAMDNQFHADYEFLQGDDAGTTTHERFDPMWGRWPQWSELFAYTGGILDVGRPGETSNLHRLGFGWACVPHEKLKFRVNYHLLWGDENPGTANFRPGGNFRGQLAEAKLTYKLCDYVSGHLVAEGFFPGDFYAATRQSPASFFRYELTFTW